MPWRSITAMWSFLDRQHFVDYFQRNLKRRPDGFTPVHRGVAVEDLLQHFGVRDQTLPRCNQTLQDDLRFRFVRMRSPDQIHGNVGVHQDQPS
jgi:hypothetical protein